MYKLTSTINHCTISPLSSPAGADLAFHWGGGVVKIKKNSKGVEGPAPGELFLFPKAFSCNLRHIGHCFSLSISPNHKETPKYDDDFFLRGGLNPPNPLFRVCAQDGHRLIEILWKLCNLLILAQFSFVIDYFN